MTKGWCFFVSKIESDIVGNIKNGELTLSINSSYMGKSHLPTRLFFFLGYLHQVSGQPTQVDYFCLYFWFSLQFYLLHV